jgi:hypothetical protein
MLWYDRTVVASGGAIVYLHNLGPLIGGPLSLQARPSHTGGARCHKWDNREFLKISIVGKLHAPHWHRVTCARS